MRVVFMGTPAFAVPSLRMVAARHEVLRVWTRPDAVSTRGTRPSPSEVKRAALSLGLPVAETRTLTEPSIVAAISNDRPDAIVVAAFGALLPPAVLAIPPLGCVNVHASLLPRWRGAAPIARAILAGDALTGISIIRMDEGLDTGPVCAQARTEVGDKYLEELTAELAQLGAELLDSCLERLSRGECTWVPQDERAATYAPKITQQDVALCPELSATDLVRRVRASSDSAPARAMVAGRRVRVVRAEVHGGRTVPPGEAVVVREGVVLGCAGGAVLIRELVPEGRRRMSSADWARGLRMSSAQWSAPE